MSASSEQANEFAVESLKLILTLASATLALMVTFLKDVIGGGSGKSQCFWLLPLGWIFLLLSIFFAWTSLVGAASRIASDTTTVKYAFGEDKTNTGMVFWPIVSWFLPFFKTKENNGVRKLAAASQNYFLLGLAFSGLFSILNFQEPKAKESLPQSTVKTDSSASISAPPSKSAPPPKALPIDSTQSDSLPCRVDQRENRS